jgi:hypothetical protein
MVPVLRSRATAEDGGGARGGGRLHFINNSGGKTYLLWEDTKKLKEKKNWIAEEKEERSD